MRRIGVRICKRSFKEDFGGGILGPSRKERREGLSGEGEFGGCFGMLVSVVLSVDDLNRDSGIGRKCTCLNFNIGP